MCGEFYPGWFDTWGYPHHRGGTDTYLKDLEYMLRSNASFSIYMADGGTSFGMWAGADTPFKPDTSSYDYDAPISEAGWCGEKYNKTRALLHRYLLPGEVLLEPDKAAESIAIPPFRLSETANVFDNLPLPVGAKQPDTMECYDQGRGCILYRTELKPGAEVTLSVGAVHDFAWIFLDGKQVGVMDRRSGRFAVRLPHRATAVQLDILVEAMGRVNFGKEVHDRKGVHGPIKIATAGGVVKELLDWKVFSLPLDGQQLLNLSWKNAYLPAAPAFWHGRFDLDKTGDTFLDLRSLGKGVLWVNGHCIARFWNIGPTQTAYVPGVWLKSGRNEVIVLDLIGPQNLTLAGLKYPILDQLRPELDFSHAQKANGILQLAMKNPVLTAKFDDDSKAQLAHLPEPTRGRQFGLEILSEYGDAAAAVAELDLLDATGQNIPHGQWTIAYVDSEEKLKEDGSAINAINGQVSDCWRSKQGKSHYLVIDLGSDQEIGAFKYTPSSSAPISRIESFRLYVGNDLVTPRLP
jgi:beta-galactosidase